MNPTQIGTVWGKAERGEGGVVVWQGTCSLCTLHSCGQNGAMASALYYLFHLLLGTFCAFFVFGSCSHLALRRGSLSLWTDAKVLTNVWHKCICVSVCVNPLCVCVCEWVLNLYASRVPGKQITHKRARPLAMPTHRCASLPLHAPLWGIICV